ncbi:LysR family transcriptional regulator [Nocardioides sp. MAH-18]|uniref:LysR family transcriptional regulator n=1 Tax=Nocardioides agri TaxID=2682843 RepID=A0A6L6XSB9_9ACTN|nr:MULTISPECIES: LysR family transcriptional regulator [unclassified Nocardioides]MBA2955239.1 LysR family transcriptional regulator [Nocardioides sp. CGMCC 1.13656]MVQ50090.1 LysR family transcriptional regulator [Nocardioides sp. MAH-18]
MELRHLRSFAVLAEEQHFGRAAARLHIAQPALSQQVKQLERELGTPLFTRTTRRVELTEAGARFAEHARTVLADVTRAEDDMALLASGRAGRVSVGFIGTATYDVLPRAAREVRAALPDVDLELRGELLSPQLVAGLHDRTYDIALLRPDPLNQGDLDVRPLRTERLVAVLPAGHPLAGRSRIALSSLATEAFVMHPSGHRSSVHARVLEACAAAGFTPSSVLEVGETATLVVFVAAGLGVALVPEPVRSLGLDGVAYVPLTDAPTIDLALATRAGDDSPAVRRVAEIVAACV